MDQDSRGRTGWPGCRGRCQTRGGTCTHWSSPAFGTQHVAHDVEPVDDDVVLRVNEVLRISLCGSDLLATLIQLSS